jgi:hypothetical protein
METTKIENEKAKMQCNQLEILWCIKELAKEMKWILGVLNASDDTKGQLLCIKNVLMSDKYTEKESADLLIYIETWQLLARRLKNCTNLETLKAENSIATARINRVSKSCQNIAHRAVWVEAVGGQRVVGSNRVTFL